MERLLRLWVELVSDTNTADSVIHVDALHASDTHSLGALESCAIAMLAAPLHDIRSKGVDVLMTLRALVVAIAECEGRGEDLSCCWSARDEVKILAGRV